MTGDHADAQRIVLSVLDQNNRVLDAILPTLPAMSPMLLKRLMDARAASAAAAAAARDEVGAAAADAALIAQAAPAPAPLSAPEIAPTQYWCPTALKNVPLDHVHRYELYHHGVTYQLIDPSTGTSSLHKSPPLKHWQKSGIRWVVNATANTHASEVKMIALGIDALAAKHRADDGDGSPAAGDALARAVAELVEAAGGKGKGAALTWLRANKKEK